VQSQYRPPAAPLGPSRALPARSLGRAVAVGVAASLAAIVLLSAVFAITLVAVKPELATGGLSIDRMRQFPGLLPILLAVYAFVGLVGGWFAAPARRGTVLVALVLSAVFAGIVCSVGFLAGGHLTWAQIANLATYAVGAVLGSGVARRRDDG
jgi:hypothetical protein